MGILPHLKKSRFDHRFRASETLSPPALVVAAANSVRSAHVGFLLDSSGPRGSHRSHAGGNCNRGGQRRTAPEPGSRSAADGSISEFLDWPAAGRAGAFTL